MTQFEIKETNFNNIINILLHSKTKSSVHKNFLCFIFNFSQEKTVDDYLRHHPVEFLFIYFLDVLSHSYLYLPEVVFVYYSIPVEVKDLECLETNTVCVKLMVGFFS